MHHACTPRTTYASHGPHMHPTHHVCIPWTTYARHAPHMHHMHHMHAGDRCRALSSRHAPELLLVRTPGQAGMPCHAMHACMRTYLHTSIHVGTSRSYPRPSGCAMPCHACMHAYIPAYINTCRHFLLVPGQAGGGPATEPLTRTTHLNHSPEPLTLTTHLNHSPEPLTLATHPNHSP